VKDLSLSEITPAFAKDLLFYLKGERKFSHNYAAKMVQAIKRVLQYAFDSEYIKRNPLATIKLKLEKPKEIIHLEEHELEKLEHLQLASESLKRVLDVFIFCCFSGLAYVDVAALHPTHFKVDKNGTPFIIMKRGKTGTTSYIPLFPQAIQILNKYESDPDCIAAGKLLPVLTNQKMNTYLKEIAFVAGLKPCLTMHVARKSFAMFLLNNGIAIESVSTILGHSKIQVTQSHYAKIKVDTIAKDFKEFAARKGLSAGETLKMSTDGRV
jgi:site-specific recombinase XerD